MAAKKTPCTAVMECGGHEIKCQCPDGNHGELPHVGTWQDKFTGLTIKVMWGEEQGIAIIDDLVARGMAHKRHEEAVQAAMGGGGIEAILSKIVEGISGTEGGLHDCASCDDMGCPDRKEPKKPRDVTPKNKGFLGSGGQGGN